MRPREVPAPDRASASRYRLLLPPERLLCAIQGHLDDRMEIAGWARELGCLYRAWTADPTAGRRVRAEIGEVIGAIDAWISGQLPRPAPGSPRGTDSVGGVIARVAEAWACAYWTLHENDDPIQRHRAWDHLAEMREGYADFARQVHDGAIILPKSWPSIGWPGLEWLACHPLSPPVLPDETGGHTGQESRSAGHCPAISVAAMDITTKHSTIESVVLESPDPAAAEAFYTVAFGLGDRVRVRASEAATAGFRGFVLSLVVAGPSTVDGFIGAAVEAGATTVKQAKKSFWGYGGVVQAPDGVLWKIATSSKKNTRPATREVDDFVVLLGVDNVKATKQFYVERGLTVAKSFGGKYVEFDTSPASIKLALYGRRAAAKDAGVPAEGSGSHRIAIRGNIGSFTDPDGFAWEAAGA